MYSSAVQYFFAPYTYLSTLMPEETGSKTDAIRRGGRYISGAAGLAAGCTACAFVAPAVYAGASTLNAKATDVTTPDGTPGKELSVTAADKFGGGLAAAVVSYFLISHITVATVAVGGLLTDCVVGAGESCYQAGAKACQKTAQKCYAAANCLKQAFRFRRAPDPQQEARVEPPQIHDAAAKV